MADRLLALGVLAFAATHLFGCGGSSPTPVPPPPAPPSPPPPPPPPPPPWVSSCSPSCAADGYVQNWGMTMKWWDSGIPGNCIVGCFDPAQLLPAIAPYESLSYIGVWLTEDPTSNPVCSTGGDCCNEPSDCPLWDGQAIYLASTKGKAGDSAIAVNESVTASHVTPGIVGISEAVRLARMHPAGPKKMKITLGGWSDYARIGTAENGQKVGKLLAKLVQWTFADGADLDLEHLTPFAELGDEYAGFAALAQTLRSEFDDVVRPQWKASAQARLEALTDEYEALPLESQTQMRAFYDNQRNYMREVAENVPERLELSWTTRFNAFVPNDDAYNYITDDSAKPTNACSTDNEGKHVWTETAEYFDFVHIMGYDAAVTDSTTGQTQTFELNFSKVLDNFVELGPVPPEKLIMGFGPGEQDAGAQWEGMDADVTALLSMNESAAPSHGGYGGSFVWSVNSDPTQTPVRAKEAPLLAAQINQILEPRQLWSSTPQYTTCNPLTGNWPTFVFEQVL